MPLFRALRRVLVLSCLALPAACESPAGGTASDDAPSSAAPSASTSRPKVASDESRDLDLMVEQTDAMEKAGPGCAQMTAALVAWNAKVAEERRGIQERLAAKKRAGEKPAELDEADRARFERMKKTRMAAIARCVEDQGFLEALTAPPGGSIVYRDPRGRFEATFPAAPEPGERKGPSSLTEAATLIHGGNLYSVSYMTLLEPAAYGCDVVLEASRTRISELPCKVIEDNKVTAHGLSGREFSFECTDGNSARRRTLCDSRPDEKLVYVFETQLLGPKEKQDAQKTRAFIDGSKLLSPSK